jgi:hypothetical protein
VRASSVGEWSAIASKHPGGRKTYAGTEAEDTVHKVRLGNLGVSKCVMWWPERWERTGALVLTLRNRLSSQGFKITPKLFPLLLHDGVH